MDDETPPSTPARLHAFVSGNVQGVSFRWYTLQAARQLSLTGYARNLDDGRVEVEAEGERDAVEALLSYLHRGSPGASVTQVDVRWLPAESTWSDFEIR